MTNNQTNLKFQYLKNIFHYFDAIYWAGRCGWPGKKLYVIGVTGTDGKTTTSTLIYEILKNAGYKVGLFSTVSVKYVEELPITNYQLPIKSQNSNFKEILIEKGLHTTNPGPKDLQPILKQMLDAGITHVVLEVTSHGLDQNRVAGIDFQIGVLTNITHEHLDYHGTMENYIKAKEKLFRKVRYAILPNFKFLIFNFKTNPKAQIIKYSKTKIKNVSESLVGDYNSYNISAATEVAKILNIQTSIINEVVKQFKGVPGRRQEVKNNKGIKVYVDFAHTPNALGEVLKQLRKELKYHPPDPPLSLSGGRKTQPKLLVVFGCTGERDKAKRPMMGEIAARLADVVIVTSDDTRLEDQSEIAKEILAGITNKERVLVINDRREAIRKAIMMAKKGDIVLLAGKGHEKSILIGETEYPWSDVDEADKILKEI